VDLLSLVDGILLQWYSGFDAGLCAHNSDPMACACTNMPAADYPNVLNTSKGDGLIASYWTSGPGVGGYMFPKTFPVRCQACGKNVRLPNGKMGSYPCAGAAEEWYEPTEKRNADGTSDKTAEHKQRYTKYASQHGVPHWWVKDVEISSACPRGLDCPDWQYRGEPRYSRQLKLLTSLSAVVDLSKVSIGFETMGIDVLAQFEAYVDPALPWGTVPASESYKDGKYWVSAYRSRPHCCSCVGDLRALHFSVVCLFV
jgi:hypothetical protein